MAAPLTVADTAEIPGQVNVNGPAQISVYAGPGPDSSASTRTLATLKPGENGIIGGRRVDNLNATDYGFGAAGIQYFLTTADGLLIPDVAGLRSLEVLSNDTPGGTGDLDRIDGSTLTVTVAPAHGLALPYQGQIQYAPHADYVGADTLSYTVKNDSGQASAEAIVTLDITAAAGASPQPIAFAVARGASVTIDAYQAFSTDFDQTIQSVEVTTQPAHGTADEVGTSVTYIPQADFSGQDSFEWRMLINGVWSQSAIVRMQVGLAINRPGYKPVGSQVIHPAEGTRVENTQIHATPDAASTPYGTPVTLSPLDNDLPQGGIKLQSVTEPSHGTLFDHGDGTFTYTPAVGWAGADIFTYNITDGIQPSSAIVSVTTLPPQLAATPDYAATVGTAPVAFGVLVNDIGLAIAVTAVSNPPHGTAAIVGGGVDVQYQADPGFSGEDVFGYTITDAAGRTATGMLHVTVLAPPLSVNPPSASTRPGVPVTVPVIPDVGGLSLTDLTAPLGGTNAIAGGSVTYLPHRDFAGVDTFLVTVVDGYGQNNVLTVTINVVPSLFKVVADRIAVFGGVAEIV